MKLDELATQLNELGLPLAYYQFNSIVQPPFLCYLESGTETFLADDRVYKEVDLIDIELYTDKKDKKLEKRVADLLNDLELPYEKSSFFIESENIYKINYEVSLI